MELKDHSGNAVNDVRNISFDSEVIVAYNPCQLHIWARDTGIDYCEPVLDSPLFELKLHGEYLLTACDDGLSLRETYSGSIIYTYNKRLNHGCAMSNQYVVGVKIKQFFFV